jgi:steroid delta-isomerase-like uncharacterized protein
MSDVQARNMNLVQQYYASIWSGGRVDAIRDFVADDAIDHNPLHFPGRASGAAGLAQVVAMIRAAIPDLQRTVEDQLCHDDKVVTRFIDEGTHQGNLMGVPATGQRVRLTGINIELIREDKIRELWHVEDLLGLLAQIGALPQPTRH